MVEGLLCCRGEEGSGGWEDALQGTGDEQDETDVNLEGVWRVNAVEVKNSFKGMEITRYYTNDKTSSNFEDRHVILI